MKRTVIAATVVSVALGGAGLASAKPAGNGAQKAGLFSAMGLATPLPAGLCSSGTGQPGDATGSVMLNAPGKPGAARKILGEVSLKGGTADTTYDVRLATGSSNCGTVVATLTTDAQGYGNAHLTLPVTPETTPYYVVLANGPVEAFASSPVTLR